MRQPRLVTEVLVSRPTIEGAGVRLKRAFGFDQLPRLDPFLMLDDFRSIREDDFRRGFPWHPHRGMETITYVLEGRVAHEDSLGNKGLIGAGDVQWMTAGSGIIHQEMPKGDTHGELQGFQLWANLPAKYKMMDPRYQDVRHDTIPAVELEGGAKARVIAGQLGNIRGPVEDIVTEPEYLDIRMPADAEFTHTLPFGRTVFAYVLNGEVFFHGRPQSVTNGQTALFGAGDRVNAHAGPDGARFLLISGKPLGEPIAWRGPVVMNTHAEIERAFEEMSEGTFIKVSRQKVKTA
jgi:quercetin 2,3-dioxygenase